MVNQVVMWYRCIQVFLVIALALSATAQGGFMYVVMDTEAASEQPAQHQGCAHCPVPQDDSKGCPLSKDGPCRPEACCCKQPLPALTLTLTPTSQPVSLRVAYTAAETQRPIVLIEAPEPPPPKA